MSEKNHLLGMLLVVLGALFLLGIITGSLWTLFVILPGLPFLYFALTGDKRLAGLIFPGLIISGSGLILLYQSIFNHFESWAYVWTLYPGLVGLGVLFVGSRIGKKDVMKAGKAMMRGSVAVFAVLGLFFELLIFSNILSGVGGLLVPAALIGLGIYLLNKDDDPDTEKLKNDFKPKREIINPELQRQIDEALAEDDARRAV